MGRDAPRRPRCAASAAMRRVAAMRRAAATAHMRNRVRTRACTRAFLKNQYLTRGCRISPFKGISCIFKIVSILSLFEKILTIFSSSKQLWKMHETLFLVKN